MAEGNALGAVFTGSPNTSSYSNPQVNLLLAGGGGGGNAMTSGESNALGVAQQAQQLQSGKVTIDQQTFNLAKAKLDAVHQLLGAVVANPNDDTFTTQLGIGVQAGTVDPKTAADLASHVASFGGDRTKIQQFALDGLNNNASHQEILQQAYGTPGLYNTGGGAVGTLSRTGASAGTTLSGAPPIANTVTPAERMGGLTTKNSDGSSTFRPNSTLYDDKGNFIGAGGGGASGTPSIPVYRGAVGSGAAPGGNGQGGAPAPATAPGVSPVAPQGSAAAGQVIPPGRVPVGYPASSGADSGTQSTVPLGGAPSAVPPTSAASAGGAASGAMVTPNPQTLPVISADVAKAAIKAYQGGEQTAANRNILRGYAVQNNLTDQLQHMGPFEPQPAGVGAGVVVPPQPASGQGGAPAAPAPAPNGPAVPPGRPAPAPVQPAAAQPQGQQAGAGQGSFGSRFGAQPGPAAGLTVGLSPGQEASLKVGSDTYSALASDVASPSGSNKRIFNTTRALDAIRNTTTGRGTAMRQEMLGTLDALPGGIGRLFPGVDPASITNYDLATKYSNAIAQSSPGALRSDAGQALASSANANTSGMTQQAATDVLTNQLGQERMNQAQYAAFNGSHTDPGQFPQWSAQWTRGIDPRAFALADMTPAERTAVWSGLKGPARAAFTAGVNRALASGTYTRADIQQGAAANGQ